MDAISAMEQKHGLRAICYGHAGDGNIHVNILKENIAEDVWKEVLPRAVRELFTTVFEMGGTLSGEHGVGFVQKGYLPLVMEPEQIRSCGKSNASSIRTTFSIRAKCSRSRRKV